MKGIMTLAAILFLSLASMNPIEAKPKENDRIVVIHRKVVVKKPVAKRGYWKWNARLRRHVWVATPRTVVVKRTRVVTR